MHVKLRKGEARGSADYGWLKARYSFSFAQYQNKDRMHFGALRVLNDDIIDAGEGFGKHPHDNMEIVTIPLQGALMHRDSMGHEEKICEDDVQVMSAGTGIFHSEFNASETHPAHILQLWIFPERRKIAPRYAQDSFSRAEARNSWQVLVRPMGNQGLTIHQQAYISRTFLAEGESITYALNKEGNKIYLFQVKGKCKFNDLTLEDRDAVEISQTDNFSFLCTEDAHVIAIEVPELPEHQVYV